MTGINQTTRDDIARLVEQGVEEGLSPAELGNLISGSTSFDAARAELISRTETMLAYNDSALRTYSDYNGQGGPGHRRRHGRAVRGP